MNVKVIASLGPASGNPDIIHKMISLGVSGFRVNFAHGNPDLWSSYAGAVRDVEKNVGRYVSLIGDIVGPSLRLGELRNPIVVKKGSLVRFSLVQGPPQLSEEITAIPVNVPRRVFESISEGDVVVMDDGKLTFSVVEVGETYFDATAQVDSIISSRKTFVVRGKEFDLPIVGKKDLDDLKFACANGFDYLGLSYVRSSEDVAYVRKILEKLGCGLNLLAKIETLSALRNLDDIIEASDGVVVARGDLGMNLGLEEIPILQKKIIKKSREYGKPVIVATQLLESMIGNPIPTRAEVVDVYEAVENGVDALMVTGETAVGKYPLEVVKWLTKIIKVAESHASQLQERSARDMRTRFVKGVVELAEDLNATLIIYSMRGNTARRASAMRPKVPVYVGVPSPEVARKLSILWGLTARVVEASTYMEGLEKLYTSIVSDGYLKAGDIAVLSYGLVEEYEEVIKIRRVSL